LPIRRLLFVVPWYHSVSRITETQRHIGGTLIPKKRELSTDAREPFGDVPLPLDGESRSLSVAGRQCAASVPKEKAPEVVKPAKPWYYWW
jgi:hypothetical protein